MINKLFQVKEHFNLIYIGVEVWSEQTVISYNL